MSVYLTRLMVTPYTRPLRPPVRTAHGPMVQRHGLEVIVQLDDGSMGYGEVAPWPGFANVADVQVARAAVSQELTLRAPYLGAEPLLLGPEPEPGQALFEVAARALTAVDALGPWTWALAQGALHTAVLDALGHRFGVPMARLFTSEPAMSVPVHALVSTAFEAQTRLAMGYRHFKIKVGGERLDEELGKLLAIRAAVGPDASLRLDANGAWPLAVAQQALRMYNTVSPAWLEQPVAADDVAGLVALTASKIIPIAADESVTDAATLEALLDQRALDGVVLKPAFVGGPQVAVAMGQAAMRRGYPVHVTHALEGPIGRAMAVQVACALNLDDPCGLDGDPAQKTAMASLPDGPGLGLPRGPQAPL